MKRVVYQKTSRTILKNQTSYTKFGPPIRHFRRLQAFLKSINEIGCMDLDFVDKLASQNKGVKSFLVAVDFSEFKQVKKVCERHYKKIFSRKNTSENSWVDK